MNKAEKFKLLTCTQKIRQDLRARSVRAAAFTGAAGAIDFVIRIGSTAILARLVLPEHFGLVMMVTAVTAVADQFRDLGLSAATVQKKDISHEEVSNLFWVNVAAGCAIAMLVCAISPLISLYYKDSRLTPITCILATNFVLGGLMVQHQALLTRQLRLGHTSTIRLLSSFASTVLAVILAWMGFGYWALIWREVARSVFLTAGMWLCFPWMPGLPSRKTDIRGLMHFGTNLAGANILASISSGVDRLLIGRYWHAGPVAMYRQAYQLLVTPMEQLLGPVYQVSQPGLSMLQTEDGRFRRFYQKVLTLVCVASMPLSLFVAVYYAEITRIVLGRKWADAAPILMILSLGTFIKQAVGSAAWVLITRGRAKTYLALTVVQNAAVIIFMLVGVKWGPRGVAVADVAATYLLIGPKLHYSLKDSPVTISAFFAAIARPALSSIVMGIALMLLHLGLPAVGAPAALAFGCVVAGIVFPAAWMLMPGGKAELLAFASDIRSVWQRKVRPTSPVEPAAGTDQPVTVMNTRQNATPSSGPRVSVILTVYKRTDYLRKALDSVLTQSYEDYEIIVADDSGTGASREIVAACGQPERLKYLPNPGTLGIAASLVRAVEQARGEFIAILNDDDVWEKGFLAGLVAPLQADPQRVLAFCDHWLMDQGGNIDHALSDTWSANFERSHLPEGVVHGAADFCVIKHGIPIAVASLFRKDAFDWSLVATQVTGAYDYWISCLLAATGRPIYYVPKRMARWRMHEGMETRRRSHDKGENLVHIFSVLRERGWFPELDSALKVELAEALFAVGRDKLHFDRTQEARSYFWRCFLLRLRPGAFAGVLVSFLPGSVRAGLRECLGIVRKGTGLLRRRQVQNPLAAVRPAP